VLKENLIPNRILNFVLLLTRKKCQKTSKKDGRNPEYFNGHGTEHCAILEVTGKGTIATALN
jgi:hypothetical protein